MCAPRRIGDSSRDDLFEPRTDRERAAEYLHRGRPPRPKAAAQEEALFDQPEHQKRRFVPLGRSEDALELFAKPEAADRELLPVPGWPDYRAKERRDGGGDDG